MNHFAYQAVDAAGHPFRGTLMVASQSEALQRLRDMGLFPVKLAQREPPAAPAAPRRAERRPTLVRLTRVSIPLPFNRVKARTLASFTRQLATLIDAGMPLLRGLRILEQQETHPRLRRVLTEIGAAIEGGGSLTEAIAAHPQIFNALYVNLVRAGEVGGALEVTLRRLAEFLEKAQKIKGKIKAALFYPVSVMIVAAGILVLMMVFIVPRFQEVFAGLLGGAPMPAFTQFVMQLSDLFRHQAPLVGLFLLGLVTAMALGVRTRWGRWSFDRLKLAAPILGPGFRKSAISRLTRTLGTLLSSGVPVLQALTIVKETAGNVVVGRLVQQIHASVKQGDTVTAPLRQSRVFTPVQVGMVDVGEQTGALPDMLLKIADQCDDDVDNAVSAMTSLLEPILIVFLAVIVGSIVIAMFLPILGVLTSDALTGGAGE